MGWFIGNKITDPVITNFNGGFTSDEAYISVSGEYYYQEKLSRMTISIAVYKSKSSMEAGDKPIPCSDLSGLTSLIFGVTIEEMSTVPIFDVVIPKTKAKLEELVPTWTDKLIWDLD